MARYARKKSESGIYHIMLRGINRQNIFEDDEDRQRLIETIKRYKVVCKYEIYGYCLMSNHVHLLLSENGESLSIAIKRICGSYVYWYNLKYGRYGHLFQDRYKSETVGEDGYFLTVLRYIHQNPVKAGISRNAEDFVWSSYKEYTGETTMVDTTLAMDILSSYGKREAELFEIYMDEPNQDKCLEYEEKARITDNEVIAYFANSGLRNISDLQHKEKNERDGVLKAMKSMEGVTIRQLSRITGIPKSIIHRV